MPNFMGMANQNTSSPPLTTRFRSFFTAFNPGDTSWTCPSTGYYTWTSRGAGGSVSGSTGGGAGAATQTTVLLFTGQVVTISIGRAAGRGTAAANGGDTVITFPSGRVVTAGGGVSGSTTGAGGTATGGDTNVNGAASSGGTGGTSPALGYFGAVASSLSNNTDGAGTGGSTDGGGTNHGGGQGIVYLQAGKV